jgi:diguanylate cyclase (GGDEF)-like protein/PAS domain S-box-containing protein
MGVSEYPEAPDSGLIMSKQYHLILALCRATIAALFLGAGLEALKQAVVPTRLAWQAHAATILLCASVVFLSYLWLLWRENTKHEKFFETIVHGLPMIACVFDGTGRFRQWNSKFEALLGYTSQELANLTAVDIIAEDQRTTVQQIIAAAFSAGTGEGESVLVAKDSTLIPCRLTGVRIILRDVPYVLGIAADLRNLKQAEESALRLASIVEFSEDAIIGESMDGVITSWNRAAEKMYGHTMAEAVGRNSSLLLPSERQAEMRVIMGRIRSGEPIQCFETQALTKAGSVLDISLSLSPIKDARGRVRGASTIARDITARKAAEKQVQFLAYYDALTGLPNRTLLQDRLAKALAGARRQKNKVAILFLDLDLFKNINDSLGHSAGDRLLQEVAERLKTWGREQDSVARVGGDEFILVLNDVKSASDAAVAAERLMDAMTAEFVVQSRSLNIGCSLGISIFPEHGADGETLIKNADAAMYSAKEYGRNNFQFFTSDMNAQVMERLTLENSLRLALAKKELFLVYQPQMDMASGRITGLEALLRWQHSELGLVPPDKFIRIAENSGLIAPIGEWVLRTACTQARKWQDEGLPAVTVAVNVSAVQFRQENFCEFIRIVLHETGLSAQYLELELTESLLLSSADLTLSLLRKLKATGVMLSIDDFGTGYSSFGYLRQFQVNKLKIDRSFIRDVAVKPDDAAITAAIISMAKNLNLKVIAEGVENEAQMSFLRGHQCDEVQGYYVSRPLAADKVPEKLRGTAVHAFSANHGA